MAAFGEIRPTADFPETTTLRTLALLGHSPGMASSVAIKTASILLIIAAIGGGLAALFLAALSALLVYTHVTADKFSVSPVAWLLNPAVGLTPVLFGTAGLLAVRAVQRKRPRHLIHSLTLCCLSILIMWSYVKFEPLGKVDSCFDAGGVWRSDRCYR